MKVALFGGTGFIGSYITQSLVAHGHAPTLLVRHGKPAGDRHVAGCDTVSGDIGSRRAIMKTLEDTDAVIYNIGIIREYPSRGITYEELHYRGAVRVMEAAEKKRVPRFLLMSANGVNRSATLYHLTKYLAEERLRKSTLKWTIFRPSVVYGDPCGKMEFCTEIRDRIVRPPVPAPLFFTGLSIGSAGAFRLSPVHVTDVAEVFVRSLETESSIGKTFELGGPVTVDWKTLIKTIATVCGKHKVMIPVPASAALAAAKIFEMFPFFPVTHEQLAMLITGNTCNSNVFDQFNITPLPFSSEHIRYLHS